MKKIITLLFLLAASPLVFAQVSMDAFFPVDVGHSYIGFEVQYMGYAKVKGRFEKFSGAIHYDENNLKATSVSFQVDATSIDTDHDWRDKDLKSDNWFGVETYPAMHFSSTQVKVAKKGFEVTGNLTIKEVTKEVIFTMAPPSGVLSDVRGDKQVIFTGYTEIDRTDFNVEGKNWSKVKEGIAGVGNRVKIEVSILGKQYQEGNLKGFVRNPKSPPGALFAAYEESGVKGALEKFEALQADEAIQLNENALNILSYLLIRQGKIGDATQLTEANLNAFPESSNLHNSMGDVLARKGDLAKAKEYFEKSLDLDPNNMSSKEKLRHLN